VCPASASDSRYFVAPRRDVVWSGHDGRGEVEWAPVPSGPDSAPSFAQVYEDFASFVWRSMRRLGVPPGDVEDAAQEVFVVIHRKLPEFAGRSSLKTWCFGICLRVASDWRKKAHVRKETVLDEAPERTTSGETPIRGIAQQQARAKLHAMLEKLDEDKRTVFVLFDLEQVPMQEVADSVGVPLQTAYARLYAARKAIEAHVAAAQEVVA